MTVVPSLSLTGPNGERISISLPGFSKADAEVIGSYLGGRLHPLSELESSVWPLVLEIDRDTGRVTHRPQDGDAGTQGAELLASEAVQIVQAAIIELFSHARSAERRQERTEETVRA